jgi:hypothetical protein
MKCANCDNDALWLYEPDGANDVPYCDKDLPSFLREQARAGLLRKTEAYDAVAAEVATILAPPVELAPVPVKKPRAKKAAPAPVEEV